MVAAYFATFPLTTAGTTTQQSRTKLPLFHAHAALLYAYAPEPNPRSSRRPHHHRYATATTISSQHRTRALGPPSKAVSPLAPAARTSPLLPLQRVSTASRNSFPLDAVATASLGATVQYARVSHSIYNNNNHHISHRA